MPCTWLLKLHRGPLYLLLPFLSLIASPDQQSVGPIPVRYTEGLARGFLVLEKQQGEKLAHGDFIQTARGNVVTSRLAFRFRDKSVYDETTVYSERRRFQLISYHLVQKGPSFPHPQDLSIQVSSGRVAVRYTDDSGQEKSMDERMKLPANLANGLLFTLVKNISSDGSETKASMIVTDPKPRLVTLVLSAEGADELSIGGEQRRVTRFLIKIDLGGVTGLIAPLVGKEPPSIRAWVLDGEAPVFIRSEGPLYAGGPIWKIEMEGIGL